MTSIEEDKKWRICFFNNSVLILAVLGLCCCAGFSPAAASGGYSLVEVRGLLTAVSSLAVEHGLWGTPASAAAARGLRSCGSWL